MSTTKQVGKYPEQVCRTDIQNAWRRCFGRPSPKYLSTGFMPRTLAWEDQAKAAGGLPVDIKRSLRGLARGKQRKLRQISPGAHLVREWNGELIRLRFWSVGSAWTVAILRP